jgi:hypothetical protein
MGQLFAGEFPLLRLEREEAHAGGVRSRRRRLPDPGAILGGDELAQRRLAAADALGRIVDAGEP